MNRHPALVITNSTYYACITQVIILCDGSCHSCSWSLLGKLISKLEDPGILLQHLGNFHLHGCSQLLSLQMWTQTEDDQERRGNSYINYAWKDVQLFVGQKGKSLNLKQSHLRYFLSYSCSLFKSKIQEAVESAGMLN